MIEQNEIITNLLKNSFVIRTFTRGYYFCARQYEISSNYNGILFTRRLILILSSVIINLKAKKKGQ